MSDEFQTVENERRYIARELHDGVAQTAQQLILQASLCRKLLERRRLEMLADELADLETRAQHVSNQVRELMADLRPPLTQPDAPFVEWLRAELDIHLTRGGPPAEFELQTQQTVPNLPTPVRLALIRILQEALLNVRKHAAARKITVTLAFDEHKLHLTVADDGQGFSASELRSRPPERGGAGLTSMHARALGLGGEFKIHTAPGQGTRIETSVPIK
jgi:two-component system sensor histidine kinase DegS